MARTAFQVTQGVLRGPRWAGPRTGGTPARRAELVPVPDALALEAEWRALQTHSEHSFFQSWGWIGTWLRHLPPEIRPLLLRVRQGADTIGLGLLTQRTVWRRGFVRSRSALLHETGRTEIDKLAIEHNGLLLRRDCAAAAERVALEFLCAEIARRRWDEVVLPGVSPLSRERAEDFCGDNPHLLVLRQEPSPIVDLTALRAHGAGIPDGLRQSLRKDIRRAMRRAEQYGPLAVAEARSPSEALDFLGALIALHEERWMAAGERGAFFHPWLRDFHADLVAGRFGAGEIQLLRVAAGTRPIGYLYNFRYGDRLYGYQWGLARDGAIKAGLLCDALALRHNLAGPARTFDFLHGDCEYKRRFATGAEQRLWLVLQRRRLDFRVENTLREFRRRQAWVPRLA